MPAPALPEPPPHLGEEARAEWKRVAEDLYRLGVLTEIDRVVLAAYCQASGRWVRAELTLAEMAKRGGLMVRTISVNAIQNPMVGIANKAMADMVRYATELGMTPSARTRIHAHHARAPLHRHRRQTLPVARPREAAAGVARDGTAGRTAPAVRASRRLPSGDRPNGGGPVSGTVAVRATANPAGFLTAAAGRLAPASIAGASVALDRLAGSGNGSHPKAGASR